jgi:hypothetical protein
MKEHTCAHLCGQETKISASGPKKWLTDFFFRFWLSNCPEFNNLVGITASNLNILPGLVLKDYWVTRVLRTIATDSELSKYSIKDFGKMETATQNGG